MTTIFPAAELGSFTNSWLDTKYHFSFANYYNPKRLGFGDLLVVNDDTIQAGGGFGTHPHKNMEIISFIHKGAITHRDSEGNVGTTAAGNIQIMSAGTGVYHSEYNQGSEPTHMFQLWIKPHTMNVKPRWENTQFPTTTNNELSLLASGFDEDSGKNVPYIYQHAALYGGRFDKGANLDFPLRGPAYLIVLEGSLSLANNTMVHTGDGAEIIGTTQLNAQANEPTQLLMIELNNQ